MLGACSLGSQKDVGYKKAGVFVVLGKWSRLEARRSALKPPNPTRPMLLSQIDAAVRQAIDKLLVEAGFRYYSGAQCERLTAELSHRLGASEVLLCSSGTAALELALRAAGVGSGDEVLLSAYDYPGNFWAVERVGARPLLLDVDAGSWRISVDQLSQAWDAAPAPSLKAMVVSHLHGQLQPVPALRRWCEERGIALLEDACQALGASIDGRAVGSLGNASIVSFGGSKMLSSGRGGALLTSDASLAQRAKKDLGGGSGPYALSELQATAVVAQLPWVDAIVQSCRQFFAELANCLESQEKVLVPFAAELPNTSFYQAGLLCNRLLPPQADEPQKPNGRLLSTSDASQADRVEHLSTRQASVIQALRQADVPAGVGFAGFHRRSPRRCRHWQPLQQAALVAAGTCTIHFSAALNGGATPQQIATALDQLDKK